MVCVRGVNIYPPAVEQIVRGHAGVAEYQVRVSTSESLAQLQIEIEPQPEVSDAPALARAVETALQSAFNLRIPVVVVPGGTLPRFDMKARRWLKS
jgi:phenylacetate-CoA ligase